MRTLKSFSIKGFFEVSCCPPHLEDVSRAVIQKCHGLPLAIITIASLVANKNSDAKDEWEQVKDSMVSSLNAQNIGEILLLSYYDLPCHLKTCFLYLSVFPEDYMIDKQELIWMWIAEGFINQIKGQSFEQTGENYFNDLINRSLIQPVDTMYDGWAGGFRVHDIVLDLIISLSIEQNFITILEGQVYKGSSNKTRRLSILSNCAEDEVMQEIMDKCLQVRSVFIFHEVNNKTFHISKFYHLRVLILEDDDGHLGNQHIKHIERLIQLKYLKIYSVGITKLPNQIGNLQNLQTLDIRGSAIEKLAPTISRLQNLVRLLVGGHYLHLPDEIGDLQALQVLSFVGSHHSENFVGQLRRLSNLKTLGIQLHCSDKLGDHDIGRYQKALESSLSLLAKHKLNSLEINFGNYPASDKLMDSLCSDVPCLKKLVCWPFISRLPKRMTSLVNIAHLGIGITEIKQVELCILGGIPTLLYLNLLSSEAPSERLTISSKQFCCLKEFVFRSKGVGGLRIVCEKEAMPKLKNFTLEFNAKETEFCMGFEFCFEHLASLDQLSVNINCNGATRSSVDVPRSKSTCGRIEKWRRTRMRARHRWKTIQETMRRFS
ncbi:hypothetical protein HU200_058410 [Digitaria exilis]|uniref:NB-ARC domain-containing protein n=1 Tax=Digitaria exilis TaxID=1010633 RepID=A0A835ACQ1_9POAL|nr:hypothetical protein HU200_058410 [Digitaria exilis]